MSKRTLLLVLCIATGCAARAPSAPIASPVDGIRIYDTAAKSWVDWETMARAAAGADAVFVGESHTDERTHRVQASLYDDLIARRDGRVVLAMEMFTRGEQDALDRYVRGEIDEAKFLTLVKEWGNYRTGYRVLVERARADKLPVIGSNADAKVARKIARGGREAYEKLSPAERARVASHLHDNSADYWERFARTVRGHAGMLIGDTDRRVYSMQSLWDNTMGESCANALRAHAGHTLLHLNGGFHSAYGQGTVAQFSKRHPRARVVTIAVHPTDEIFAASPGALPVADFVVYADAWARGIEQGAHAVAVPRELKYRLRVPKSAADDALPLLIWLGAHGSRPEDEARTLERMLGDEAIVAVVEGTYRVRTEQLYASSQWYWPDTFREDLWPARTGVERIQQYVTRYWNVSERVVVAGYGEGATVVAAFGPHPGGLKGLRLALHPAEFHSLRDVPFTWPDVDARLRVLPVAGSESWWQEELDAYAKIGVDAKVEEAASPSAALRAALGLAPAAEATAQTAAPSRFTVADPSPLAQAWVRMYAAGTSSKNPAVLAFPGEAKNPALSAQTFGDGKPLPRAPGPFGGTTIVVLPKTMPAAEAARWIEMGKQDVINKHDRFSHLVVTRTAGLGKAVADIRNHPHRRNVLIVPAVFCASADTMRGLRERAGSTDGLTVTWLPGLGGSIP